MHWDCKRSGGRFSSLKADCTDFIRIIISVVQIFQNQKLCKHFGLVSVLVVSFIYPVCLRFYVLFRMFGDTIQIFDSYKILKEEEELLAFWLYDVQLYVGLV